MQPLEFPPFAKDKLSAWSREINASCIELENQESQHPNDEQKHAVSDMRKASQHLEEYISEIYDDVRAGSSTIRTPLNSIMGYSELLQKEISGPIKSRQHNKLEVIKQRCIRYNMATQNFLDVAKLTHDQAVIFIEETQAAELVEKLSEANSNVQIDAIDVVINCDQFRIYHCIQELIHNTLTHAPNTPIELTIAQQSDFITISVTDHGNGITPEHHADIFKPFWRYPDDIDTFGMGLAVVKGIIELHGGYTTLTSEIGVGSTFTLHLPTN